MARDPESWTEQQVLESDSPWVRIATTTNISDFRVAGPLVEFPWTVVTLERSLSCCTFGALQPAHTPPFSPARSSRLFVDWTEGQRHFIFFCPLMTCCHASVHGVDAQDEALGSGARFQFRVTCWDPTSEIHFEAFSSTFVISVTAQPTTTPTALPSPAPTVLPSPAPTTPLPTPVPTSEPSPVPTPVPTELCLAGETFERGSCVACKPGSFKGLVGPHPCELCLEGRFQVRWK